MKNTYKKSMTKKVRLTIDECSYPLLLEKRKIRKIANIKTADEIIGRKGAEDLFIYTESNTDDRHIITENTKHFIKFVKSKKDVGVIAYTSFNEDVVNNIYTLIKKHDHQHFFGKVYSISRNNIVLKKDL